MKAPTWSFGEIPREAKVLYVHLGGAPVLSAYHNAFT